MGEIRFYFPRWVEPLEDDHWLNNSLFEGLKEVLEKADRLVVVSSAIVGLENKDFLKRFSLTAYYMVRELWMLC